MVLSCPRCDVEMAMATSEKVSAGQCKRCGGVWLSATGASTVDAALDDVAARAAGVAKRAASHPFRDTGGAPAINCPVCAAPCTRTTVASVELDRCATHGTWYDRGELKRVAAAYRSQEGAPSEAPEAPWTDPPLRKLTRLERFVRFLNKPRGPAWLVGPQLPDDPMDEYAPPAFETHARPGESRQAFAERMGYAHSHAPAREVIDTMSRLMFD